MAKLTKGPWFSGLDALGEQPRWETERTLALTAKVRGSLMSSWADNVRRRRGEPGVDAVRQHLGPLATQVPEQPEKKGWYPAFLQLRLMEAIADAFHGGEPLGLLEPLSEDSHRATPLPLRAVLRRLGPRRVLSRGAGWHPETYDEGQLDFTGSKTELTMSWTGSPLFGHPTWRRTSTLAAVTATWMSGGALSRASADWNGTSDFRLNLRWTR